MPIPSAAAANAYASLARIGDAGGMAGGLAKGVTEGAAGPSFSSLVKDAVSALSKTTHNSDMQTQAMANGKANIVDVVTAVAESEVAVNTLTAVRDRVITAYEEIMKMPI